MDYKGLAALIVRTGGLVFVIFILAVFPSHFEGYVRQPDHSGFMLLGLLVLPIGIPLAAGLLLMSIPEKISAAVAGPAVGEAAIPKQLQSLLFAGIGLYVTIQSILDLVWSLMFFRFAREQGTTDFSAFPKEEAGLYASFAGLAIGILLMVGAKGLSTLLNRLKNANTTVKEKGV